MPRKKIFLKNQVLCYPDLIYIPERNPDDFALWLARLRGQKPLYLDLGMGTGDFLVGAATLEPDTFFLGIEVKKDRIAKAYRKTLEGKVTNAGFLLSSSGQLTRLGLPKVDGIFLLFPDPWPKKRHAKRRMISKEYLKKYAELLTVEGVLVFKTDDPKLFEEALENLQALQWRISEVNRNYETEHGLRTAYEKRFLAAGKKVNYCSAAPPLLD